MTNAIDHLLNRLEAIGHVTDADRKALRNLPLKEADLAKGTEIVADGETSTSCCMVVSGYLCRSRTLLDGSRQIFSLHTAGDIPDLHSLHLNRMDHSLSAISDCRIARIPHEAVYDALDSCPSLNALLWRDTLIDSAAFRAWMLMLGQAEAVPRMAHFFCELFTRAAMAGLTDNNTFPLPLTQADLGDILGISMVHANRTLQDLRGRGVMDFDQQVVSILRWNDLRKLGQFDPSYLHYLDGRIGRENPAKL